MADSSIEAIPPQGFADAAHIAHFRRVMGCFPTGVVVVATTYHGAPHGMSVNSFASVSLEPLLLMFCASRDSRTWPLVRATGRFAVSVLGADQAETCKAFSTKGVDRFAGERWSLNRSGQPVLDGAIAWLDCVVGDVVPAGDHDIVLGRVVNMSERADGTPLVFHRGAFVRIYAGVEMH